MEQRGEVGIGAATSEFANHVYRFGTFNLDEECAELRESDQCVSVQPKVLKLLAYLIRHRDRVVTRSELLEDLWGVVSVVDGALTTAICEARHAIGDCHSVQWAIKTVPRRSYRFIAPVLEALHCPAADPSDLPHGETPERDLAMEIARLEAALRTARSRETQRRYSERIFWP